MTYGFGTRSYNRSTEKREMDRKRKVATEGFKAAPESIVVGPMCGCRSFRFPHELKAHKSLKNDYDWRLLYV